ncbi:MAG TPA: hypothetical protein VG125_01375 [Pirellulales bacterium]|jgi:hypothetical protein|nr:hypothetical protein [Pirellulales bacterium]
MGIRITTQGGSCKRTVAASNVAQIRAHTGKPNALQQTVARSGRAQKGDQSDRGGRKTTMARK